MPQIRVIIEDVDKNFLVFSSFDDAEKHDDEYYASLTPVQRLTQCFEIRNRHFQLNGIDPSELSLRKQRIVETIPHPGEVV